MSEAKHTPGPWEWRELGGRLHLCSITRHIPIVLTTLVGGPKKGSIATRNERGILEAITTDHPNARLIAAAPEQRQALIKAQTDIDELLQSPRLPAAISDKLQIIYEDLAQAIAKGES